FVRPPNWDGLGGERITAEACEDAAAFLVAAGTEVSGLPLPRTSPSALGAVSLYWRRGDQHFTVRVFSASRGVFQYETKTTGELPEVRTGSRIDVLTALKVATRVALFE